MTTNAPTTTDAERRLALIIDLKQGRRFTTRQFRGVALGYVRPVIDHPEEFEEQWEADDHWVDQRNGHCDCPEASDVFVAWMVGDDTDQLIDFDDVEVIDDEDYCSGCGQIGCGHG